ncbi:MAG: hypothetical protein D6812_06945, partial [Deltaproteobacteria bacterium]
MNIERIIEEGDQLFTEGRIEDALAKWQMASSSCPTALVEELEERIALAQEQIGETMGNGSDGGMAGGGEMPAGDTIKHATLLERFDVLADIWESGEDEPALERLIFKAEKTFQKAQRTRDIAQIREAIRLWEMVQKIAPQEKRAIQGIEAAKFELRAIETLSKTTASPPSASSGGAPPRVEEISPPRHKVPREDPLGKGRGRSTGSGKSLMAQLADLLTNADMKLRQGKEEKSREKIQQAGYLWEAALQLDPDCQEAHEGLARVRRILGSSWKEGKGTEEANWEMTGLPHPETLRKLKEELDAQPERITLPCESSRDFLVNYREEPPGLVLYAQKPYTAGDEIALTVQIRDRGMTIDFEGVVREVSLCDETNAQYRVEVAFKNWNETLQTRIASLKQPVGQTRYRSPYRKEVSPQQESIQEIQITLPLEKLRLLGILGVSGVAVSLVAAIFQWGTSGRIALSFYELCVALIVALGFLVGEKVWADAPCRIDRLGKGLLVAGIVLFLVFTTSIMNAFYLLSSIADQGLILDGIVQGMIWRSVIVMVEALLA